MVYVLDSVNNKPSAVSKQNNQTSKRLAFTNVMRLVLCFFFKDDSYVNTDAVKSRIMGCTHDLTTNVRSGYMPTRQSDRYYCATFPRHPPKDFQPLHSHACWDLVRRYTAESPTNPGVSTNLHRIYLVNAQFCGNFAYTAVGLNRCF